MINKKWRKNISLFQKYSLLMIYYGNKISFSSNNSNKKIIVCFDGLFSHGGLVDRLKGIISFYEVAKILGYDFYIQFNHPFQLLHFLKPNIVNWEIKSEDLKYNPFNTKLIYLMDNFSVNPLEVIKNSKSKTFLVYSNIDYLHIIYNENTEVQNHHIWQTNYNELFRVSNELNREIKKFPTDDRIVFHSRFTALMGDFKDSTDFVLDEKRKLELINILIEKIQEVVLAYPNKKIYVLSDSIVFLKHVKQYTSYIVLEGSPKHIGMKDNDNDLESHYKTFIDFYFMTKSDIVFLLKLDQMYCSEFSKYATIVGNKEFIILKE
ncbi:hypothetical protein [Flavobacterium sp. WC2430]|uniref:hypothetical protein n=1 Tax=Flavobacterium sp. WC2430 TaxID=3234137 RepID=UPI003466F89D